MRSMGASDGRQEFLDSRRNFKEWIAEQERKAARDRTFHKRMIGAAFTIAESAIVPTDTAIIVLDGKEVGRITGLD